MKKILVVNVNWVGDVIFSSPIFKALKEAYPGAVISCLAPLRVKEILEMIPQVDEIIVYDERGEHFSPMAKLKLILELKKKRFDIAFLLHRSLTRALFVYLAGIPIRVGYDAKKRGFLLTHKLSLNKEAVHRSDHYLNIIKSYGVKVLDRTCQIVVNDNDRRYIDELLKENGVGANDFLVAVNAGGNWDLKRWPKENFVRLINLLPQDSKVKIVICGSSKDMDLAQDISRQAKSASIILAGKTNLKQLAAFFERSNLVISADSGPFHIANCVGTRTIGLFGPTRLEVTGPRGKGVSGIIHHDVGCNRSACYYLECSENVCMKAITVEDVLEEYRKIRS